MYYLYKIHASFTTDTASLARDPAFPPGDVSASPRYRIRDIVAASSGTLK